jgi:hypothetical protein
MLPGKFSIMTMILKLIARGGIDYYTLNTIAIFPGAAI